MADPQFLGLKPGRTSDKLLIVRLARRSLIAVLLAIGFAAPVFADAGRLCATAPKSFAASTDPAFLAATGDAERLLTAGRPREARQALDVASDRAPPGLSAWAGYCTALGGVLRADPGGGAYEAQLVLARALDAAEKAANISTSGRAAYRLGLAALEAPQGQPGSRGGAATEIASAMIPLGAGISCGDGLEIFRSSEAAQWINPQNALRCASQRAREAGDYREASLADLRIARLQLASARIQPDAADRFQSAAEEWALRGLSVAIDEPDISARLVETALAAGSRRTDLLLPVLGRLSPSASTRAGLAAQLALRAGQKDAAASEARRAILIEGAGDNPGRLPDWYMLLAEIEPDQRPRHVAAAYRALDNVRRFIPLYDPLTEESLFSERMRPIFEAAVELELAQAAGTPRRIGVAQEIVEAYRQAELESVFGDYCVPPRPPVQPRDLRPGEVILYPIVARDRIELIYATAESGGYARAAASALPRQRVIQLVETVTGDVRSGAELGDEWLAASRELYGALIAPIASELPADSTLIILPDGPLRALPFGALVDADNRYLVESTRLAMAPALAYARAGEPSGQLRPRILAAYLRSQVALPAGVFPALLATEDEAIAAAGASRRGVIEPIGDFSAARLRESLSRGGVDVLHLATHAAFNGRSDKSFIVTIDGVIPITDLKDLIRQGRARGDELDLIVLSACESAVGDDAASMGLAGSAIQAGAVSAVASLWAVNDYSTASLMEAFYKEYGVASKAEALRSAQVALIESDRYTHPYYWAAFTLIGGWR